MPWQRDHSTTACKQRTVESAERAVRAAGGLEQDAASINSDTPVEASVAAFSGLN